MTTKKVAVALSGGLDSAVAAAVLVEQGYDVTGVHAVFYSDDSEICGRDTDGAAEEKNETLCRRIGAILNIPVTTIDLKSEFRSHIIDYFCAEYSQGKTPNPCIMCNQAMKFGLLMHRSLCSGADSFATGHYANVIFRDGYYRLLKGAESSKDQSYMLYRLQSTHLSRVLFPLGGMLSDDVQRKGNEYGLEKVVCESSQDICFVKGDYGQFLSERYTFLPGQICDIDGNRIGLHKGIAFYTIGQRHGLGLACTVPMYVTAIDAHANRIIVGTEDRLYRDEFPVVDVIWVAEEPQRWEKAVDVKVRYRSAAVPAVINMKDGLLHVKLKEAQRAVTPGQSVVFYCGNEVLGGGIIES